MSEQKKTPAASRSDVWDTYPGGHAVHDPYRWLEDEAQAAPWVFAQNQATEAYTPRWTSCWTPPTAKRKTQGIHLVCGLRLI